MVNLQLFSHGEYAGIRELGMATLTLDRVENFQVAVEDLPFDDIDSRRTFRYQRYHIHGLLYNPLMPEHSIQEIDVPSKIFDFYTDVKRGDDSSVVAYKGGTVEREILRDLDIPSVNLEEMFDDCPTMGYLRRAHPIVNLYDCANHVCYDLGYLRCTTVRAAFYANWLMTKRNPPR